MIYVHKICIHKVEQEAYHPTVFSVTGSVFLSLRHISYLYYFFKIKILTMMRFTSIDKRCSVEICRDFTIIFCLINNTKQSYLFCQVYRKETHSHLIIVFVFNFACIECRVSYWVHSMRIQRIDIYL